MFLAIRDGFVVERSGNVESLLELDRTIHEVVEWNQPLPPIDLETGQRPLDPRNAAQRGQDARERYKRRRLREYPSVRRQLDMMYRDAMDGTTTWMDEITRIKEKYPKPAEA